MLRSYRVAFATFLVMFLLGAALIWLKTGDNSALAQRLIDDASRAAAAQPAATGEAGSMDATGGQALGDLSAPAGQAAAAPAADQTLATYLAQAKSNMLLWFGLTMGGGLAAAWVWLALAHSRGRTVSGPIGARSAGPMWWICILLFGLLAAGASLYVLRLRGLGGIVSTNILYLGLFECLGLGLVGYYLATAFAAPVTMRPSVPLATLIMPSSVRKAG